MTGVESKNTTASFTSTSPLGNRVYDHLAKRIIQDREASLKPDDAPSVAAAPEKRTRVQAALDPNLHRAVRKLLVNYGHTWEMTIEGLLHIWVQANFETGVLSQRDIESIPDLYGRSDEPES